VYLRIHLKDDIREFFTLVTREQFKQVYAANFSRFVYLKHKRGKETQKETVEHKSS